MKSKKKPKAAPSKKKTASPNKPAWRTDREPIGYKAGQSVDEAPEEFPNIKPDPNRNIDIQMKSKKGSSSQYKSLRT